MINHMSSKRLEKTGSCREPTAYRIRIINLRKNIKVNNIILNLDKFSPPCYLLPSPNFNFVFFFKLLWKTSSIRKQNTFRIMNKTWKETCLLC